MVIILSDEIKYLVGVRHIEQLNDHIYWFEAHPDIAKDLSVGCWVLCDTIKGPVTGKVVRGPVLVARNQDIVSLRQELGFKELRCILQAIEYEQVDDVPF